MEYEEAVIWDAANDLAERIRLTIGVEDPAVVGPALMWMAALVITQGYPRDLWEEIRDGAMDNLRQYVAELIEQHDID